MDNERPIEKLLRHFAKKRRDDAPDPSELEMHPATRRILQGEAARQFRKDQNEKRVSTETSIRWWPRLVYGLSALAIVAVIAAVFVPVLSRTKFKATEAQTDTEGKLALATRGAEESAAVPLEVSKNENSAAASRDYPKLQKAADNFGVMATNSVTLALADVPRPENPASLALRETTAVPGALAISGTAAGAPLMVPPPALNLDSTKWRAVYGEQVTQGEAILTAARKTGAEVLQDKTAGEGRLNYVRQDQKAARFSNTGKADSKTPVLASFDVEQNGNELRVIDSDGSTYAGNIVLAVDQIETDKDSLKMKVEEKASRNKTPTGAAVILSNGGNSPVQNNPFFRVSGTNKTLKQQVVFSGNFIQATNAAQSQLLDLRVANQEQTFSNLQAFPSVLNNSIIVGRAQVEKDKAFDVNAEQVFQK